MSKRDPERLKAFRTEYALMISELKHFTHAPFLLIGKAAMVLLDRDEPVTKEAIKAMVVSLEDMEDAGLIARTIKVLEEPSWGR